VFQDSERGEQRDSTLICLPEGNASTGNGGVGAGRHRRYCEIFRFVGHLILWRSNPQT